MNENPIVEEVHRIRKQLLAEYNGDLRAYLRDAQQRTEEAAKQGRVVVTRGPRPVEPAPSRKVG